MTAGTFSFSAYRIDVAKRELWCEHQLAELTPQVFDCISYLLLNRARAVGRDELIAAVWGKSRVTETQLGQTIMYARRAVGDSGDTQAVIRTITRFGYRWIAEVVEQPPTSLPERRATEPATHEPPAPEAGTPEPVTGPDPGAAVAGGARRRPGMRLLIWLGLVSLVAVLAWRWWLEPGPDAHVATASAPKSDLLTVVLPVDVAESHDTAWIRLGVMDSLISRLRQSGRLTVPSQTVVTVLQSTPGGADSLETIRREINPGLVIRPSAVRVGDAWVVKLGLSGVPGLPEVVEGRAAHVLAAADAAVDRLRLAASRETPERDPLFVSQPEALVELLQRCRAALLMGEHEAADLLLASAPDALKEDPQVRLLIAEIDYRSARLGAARSTLASLRDELQSSAQAGLRGHVLLVSGSVERQYGRDVEAEAAYREAIELFESAGETTLLGNAHDYLGLALMGQQRFDEAGTALARSRVLLEGSGNLMGLADVEAHFGLLYAQRGQLASAVPRMAEAIERYRRLGVHEEAMAIQIGLASVYGGLLEHDKALANSQEAWARADRPTSRLRIWAAVVHAATLGQVGRLTDATRLLDQVEQTHGDDGAIATSLAMLTRAQLTADSGDWATSERATLAAHERFAAGTGAGWSKFRADTWLMWLRALRAQGKYAQAHNQLAAMREWDQQGSADQTHLYFALADAEQKWFDGDRDLAVARYEDALRLAETAPIPALTLMVVESYGNALMAAGDLQEAAGVVGRVADWADRDFSSALLQVRLHRALGQAAAWRQALEHARRLAGERTIPVELLALRASP